MPRAVICFVFTQNCLNSSILGKKYRYRLNTFICLNAFLKTISYYWNTRVIYLFHLYLCLNLFRVKDNIIRVFCTFNKVSWKPQIKLSCKRHCLIQRVLCFQQTVICATDSKTRKHQSFHDLNLLCNVKWRTVQYTKTRSMSVLSVGGLMKLSHKAISFRHITSIISYHVSYI